MRGRVPEVDEVGSGVRVGVLGPEYTAWWSWVKSVMEIRPETEKEPRHQKSTEVLKMGVDGSHWYL